MIMEIMEEVMQMKTIKKTEKKEGNRMNKKKTRIMKETKTMNNKGDKAKDREGK